MNGKKKNVSVELSDWGKAFDVKPKRAQRSLKEGEYDPEVRAAQARRRANRKYYEKNKARLNKKRRAHLQSPTGQYQSCKKRAKKYGVEWSLTFDEWWNVWTSAPKVFDLDTKLLKPAYLVRGNNPIKNTQMCRIDTSKGWEAGNVEIRYKLQPIPESGMVPDWSIEEGRALTWEEMSDVD